MQFGDQSGNVCEHTVEARSSRKIITHKSCRQQEHRPAFLTSARYFVLIDPLRGVPAGDDNPVKRPHPVTSLSVSQCLVNSRLRFGA